MIGLDLSLQCDERHRAEFKQILENLSQAQIAGGSHGVPESAERVTECPLPDARTQLLSPMRPGDLDGAEHAAGPGQN